MPLNTGEARSDLLPKKIPLETVENADRMGIVAVQATNEHGLERKLGVQMARIATGRIF